MDSNTVLVHKALALILLQVEGPGLAEGLQRAGDGAGEESHPRDGVDVLKKPKIQFWEIVYNPLLFLKCFKNCKRSQF